MPDFGISTEVGATVSKSGNASTTAFSFPHGLGLIPTWVTVKPMSIHAHDRYVITYDATNITVTYAFPPPTGTGNLVFEWRAGA